MSARTPTTPRCRVTVLSDTEARPRALRRATFVTVIPPPPPSRLEELLALPKLDLAQGLLEAEAQRDAARSVLSDMEAHNG